MHKTEAEKVCHSFCGSVIKIFAYIPCAWNYTKMEFKDKLTMALFLTLNCLEESVHV